MKFCFLKEFRFLNEIAKVCRNWDSVSISFSLEETDFSIIGIDNHFHKETIVLKLSLDLKKHRAKKGKNICEWL